MKQTAIITDLQKFSVHDGPGIRTMVFFKGCPLRCRWCQNPETWSSEPELMHTGERCIGCGKCLQHCPTAAISFGEAGIAVDRGACIACGSCVRHCYAGAMSLSGRTVTVEEVLHTLLEDRAFYRENGGVTLSGGEVLQQSAFARALLQQVQTQGIHTAIETCGHGDWQDLRGLAQYTDLILYDLKHPDNGIHRAYTGKGNELILCNLQRLAQLDVRVILRYPLIPGVNDSVEVATEIGRLAQRYGVAEIHLLPFHQMGEGKWRGLGKAYPFANVAAVEDQQVGHIQSALERCGLAVNIGGGG